MQRVLTGYSQYYNRRNRRVGHVFQGRHKAILCQSEGYLARLVRYIHLNPVRARMVATAEEYPYSSHRAYLGLEPPGIVDVDPVLRLFGSQRELARQQFAEYVGSGPSDDEELYPSGEKDILGSEEFVDAAIHRLGDTARKARRSEKSGQHPFDAELIIAAVETTFGMSRDSFCGSGKNARNIMAKEALILTGRDAGATVTELADITGLDTSSVSRRYDIAKQKAETDSKLAYAIDQVSRIYDQNIAESNA